MFQYYSMSHYYTNITLLLNITVLLYAILGRIQFNNTEYYIQYYSILHAYGVVFNTIFLNIQWFFFDITQYYM